MGSRNELRDARMVAAYLSGLSTIEVGQLEGVASTTVASAVKRAGLNLRGKGFAGMSLEKRRELARMGGAAVPAEKRSFSQDQELAREAGRKGGSAGVGNQRARRAAA